MSSKVSNIYEAKDNNLSEENKRLSSFDLPTKISLATIGSLKPGCAFLDIGAGPNTDLFNYVLSQGGLYTALDKNDDFLEKQKQAGANTIKGDVRNLPFENACFDIVHVRFVISHLGTDKQKAIKEVLRVTKPKGRAIFLDYNWLTAHGSKAYEKVKAFMLNGEFLFDADFGAELESEVRKAKVPGYIKVTKYPATKKTDYSQVLKMREAGTTDLTMQTKKRYIKEWNDVLDEFQREFDSDKSTAFYFPGTVGVTLTKQ